MRHCRSGNWQTARSVLTETRHSLRNDSGEQVLDGPSGTLLGYMGSLSWEAPAGWSGYRELTDK